MLHSAVSTINFTLDGDGLDDFPLGDPLMSWTLEDAAHPLFSVWACSVLRPAIEVEAWNQRYARARSIRELLFETQEFSQRNADGTASSPPRAGILRHYRPGDGVFIQSTVASIMEPFAGWISNSPKHEHQGAELLALRDVLRRLGVDPDPENTWDQTVSDMFEYYANNSRAT
jgi:hypothetical protein